MLRTLAAGSRAIETRCGGGMAFAPLAWGRSAALVRAPAPRAHSAQLATIGGGQVTNLYRRSNAMFSDSVADFATISGRCKNATMKGGNGAGEWGGASDYWGSSQITRATRRAAAARAQRWPRLARAKRARARPHNVSPGCARGRSPPKGASKQPQQPQRPTLDVARPPARF